MGRRVAKSASAICLCCGLMASMRLFVGNIQMDTNKIYVIEFRGAAADAQMLFRCCDQLLSHVSQELSLCTCCLY